VALHLGMLRCRCRCRFRRQTKKTRYVFSVRARIQGQIDTITLSFGTSEPSIEKQAQDDFNQVCEACKRLVIVIAAYDYMITLVSYLDFTVQRDVYSRGPVHSLVLSSAYPFFCSCAFASGSSNFRLILLTQCLASVG